MSITQGIVDICRNNSEGRKVVSVTLEIGELSNVLPEAVEFCFEACTRGTELAEARLVIERVPAVGRCGNCGKEFHLHAYYEPCPSCGEYRVGIMSGEELRVKELEVE